MFSWSFSFLLVDPESLILFLMNTVKYSIVIPVYNRPQELDELLRSLTLQTFSDFEVLVVEDGSTISSREIAANYQPQLTLYYFVKPNSGPGPSRNFGFEKATGNYFIVFDSDCIVPPDYLKTVDNFLQVSPLDVWGGPDKGSPDFTPLQQAMAYTMSSVFTTGGIRGGSSKDFQPRSFNMGMSKEAYKKTYGFALARFAEDIEFSIRAKNLGMNVGLISQACVFHKRRTDFKQFFKQVSNFGRGRIQVGHVHPKAIKLVHWFPAAFLIGLIFLPFTFLLNPFVSIIGIFGYLLYFSMIGSHAYSTTHSRLVACLSMPAAFVQLTGYGYGFLRELVGKSESSSS
jgi:glycosyltransferase involved in cell wall biosynthesis